MRHEGRVALLVVRPPHICGEFLNYYKLIRLLL
jgi:hypothetical protein